MFSNIRDIKNNIKILSCLLATFKKKDYDIPVILSAPTHERISSPRSESHSGRSGETVCRFSYQYLVVYLGTPISSIIQKLVSLISENNLHWGNIPLLHFTLISKACHKQKYPRNVFLSSNKNSYKYMYGSSRIH